ncbi:uncharacterized protein LOC114258035 [Camellia sinensis]|uniref:uncharacterized protein LOC114258035 n=1 Tax=Camellia sinensis TaxID=4442 RepID=UPI00103664D4|nr:uncharacterized protein LOC114258035 [Camellia sinensis]
MIKESCQVAELSWRQFEKLFMEKYFPNSVRQEMIQEFLQLKQRGMTVTQYANRFEALSRHAIAIVANETDKVRCFEWGLGSGIRDKLVAVQLPTYAQVVDRALTLEREKMDAARIQGGHNNKKDTILNNVVGKGLEGVMNVTRKGILGTISLKGPATMSIKGKPLNETNARQLREHELRKIPNPAKGATGRVFALQEGEDTGNPLVIQGILILMNSCVQVLFDSGALHFFISASCVATLGLEIERLETPMSVASPLGGVSSLNLTCDLRVMEMSDFDVIIGMDWLSAHNATIDCY